MERALTVLYKAMLWVAAVVAYGEAPAASEHAGRLGPKYAVERVLIAKEPDPRASVFAPGTSAVLAPGDRLSQTSCDDLAELCDMACLPACGPCHGPSARRALAPTGYPALVDRSEREGMHARAPPRVARQA